ncbi:unnamed protein product [Lactuca saligna]|uniref:Uncharacterized protein n=1 Tax=Lactuca saligna TaxID=75948 RepID=A0AA35V5K1_LACSI|nr:unnamed protein product [Lactuca saligna]
MIYLDAEKASNEGEDVVVFLRLIDFSPFATTHSSHQKLCCPHRLLYQISVTPPSSIHRFSSPSATVLLYRCFLDVPVTNTGGRRGRWIDGTIPSAYTVLDSSQRYLVFFLMDYFNNQTWILTNKALEANDGKPLPLYQKYFCRLTAGAIAACVGSLVELALIYEGVLALWKGVGPTVVRVMALNMGMLTSYDQSVEFFKDNLGFLKQLPL